MTRHPGDTPRPSARRLRQRRSDPETRAHGGPRYPGERRVRAGDPRRLRLAAVVAGLLALVVPLLMAGRMFGDAPTTAEPVESTANGTAGDATDPDGTDPDGTDPDGTDPDATDPDATDPDATDPDATDPDATDPDATDPEENGSNDNPDSGDADSEPSAADASAELAIPEDGPGEWQVAEFTADSGRDSGRTVRVRVRVEKTLPIDAEEAAEEAATILHDGRSWQPSEKVRFDFVGTGDADLTINIATPGTTDDLCLPADTGGELSCRNGNAVALNAKRWVQGVDAYGDDLTNYRRYLVNHEVGHYLGYGHVDCPGKGEKAPLMMQQTKGVGDCEPYPWPN